MQLQEVLQARHSVRAYTTAPIEPDHLQAILEAAIRAPSAGNLQAYRMYIARSVKARQALAAAAHGQDFVAQAPIVLVFCTDPDRSAKYGKRGERLYSVQDAVLAAAYAQLAATDLGVATCWVGAFDDQQVVRAVGAQPPAQPVAILSLGHAAETPAPTPRRPLAETVVDLG